MVSANALDPERAQGFVVVFLPPLRPDGEPTYDLRLVSDALQRYNKAAAIVIASFELIPRSMMRRLSAGEWLPASDEATLPPIYAVSRIVMSRLRLSNEVSLSSRSSTGTDSTASRQPEVQPGKRR